MYLRLDRRAPRRYTWGLFVFSNGLKSRLTQGLLASPKRAASREPTDRIIFDNIPQTPLHNLGTQSPYLYTRT